MIARILTSRWAICFYNATIFTITAAALYRAALLLFNTLNDFAVVEEVLDGVGIIFVAYGVAVEERETIMKFFRLYPEYHSGREAAIDYVCHLYGLWYIIIGLFMEVTVEVVKLPNAILNTGGIEKAVFGVGFLSCSMAAYLLLRHSFILIFCPDRQRE
jgi:hypothetical protein